MNIKILLSLFVGMLFTLIGYSQPIIDGSFDGASAWGTAIASGDNNSGWASAESKELYVVECGNYIYLGAEVTASDWMNWVFIINNKSGGGNADSWSRSIDYNHTNLPDYIVRGHFDNYAELHNWNGTGWDGVSNALTTAEFSENIIGNDQDGWVECRISKSFIGEISTGDVQFYITGNNNSHGTFDAIPSDQNATSWDHSTNHTILDSYENNISFGLPITDVSPTLPTADQQITITFDASCTALAGESKVYLHAGISTNESEPNNFDYAIGNWGQDDGVGEMISIGSDLWEFTMTSLDSYFSIDEEDDVFGFNFLFRNAAGDMVEDDGGNNYHNDVDPGDYITLSTPDYKPYLVEVNVGFDIISNASVVPTTWILYEIDPITNTEITTITSQSGGNSFNYNHSVNNTVLRKFKLATDFSGNIKYKTFEIVAHNPVNELARPSWTQLGINYHPTDATKATLVLHAPTYTTYKDGNGGVTGTNTTVAKEIIYVIGDFNGWNISESYKMNRDRDGWDGSTDADNDGDYGDYWWIELTGLVPGQEYGFQYLMDNGLQVADPYTQKVSDPDDQYISTVVYPNLYSYPSEAEDRASVLQTNQQDFNWTAPPFDQPNNNKLNIYEMLFRDFTDEGTYLAAIDKLDYIKGLGINAIHVMPVSEFEGNSSWGYNPNFYFAPDKAYGTADDLKTFIDECHMREIQVFNDLVLNHAFYSNVNAKMYWNTTDNKPAEDNPWFNADHKMVYDQAGWWGADWNHESEHTQTMVDSILTYWLDEFNFDGFRFDFTKGFGQTAQDAGDPWAGSYDQARIDLLKRMADYMWTTKPGSVVIFEHLANQPEDKVLADYGILLWSGVGHHNQMKNFVLGYNTDDTDIYNTGIYNSGQNNYAFANLMSYPESHDEERLAYELSQYFNGAKTTENVVDRMKLGLAFNLMFPGPRMLWQMEELAYDISIDYNGRTGEKPVKWDYYEDLKRRELYRLIQKIFKLRNEYNIYNTIDYGNIGLGIGNVSVPRRMSFTDGLGRHIIVIGNLDPNSSHVVSPNYPVVGGWYSYNGDLDVDGMSHTVNSNTDTLTLESSEVRILTNFKIDDCLDVVNTHNSGYGSLRSAIACANSGDTLRFDYTVWNDSIMIDSPILLNKDLSFFMEGQNIALDGSNSTNVLSISTGSIVSMSNLKIICGSGTSGRCIDNDGTIHLQNVDLIDNQIGSGNTILNQTNGSINIKDSLSIKK